MISAIVSFVMGHQLELLSFALGLSELLAIMPGVKSNSIFQLLVNLIKSGLGKSTPAV